MIGGNRRKLLKTVDDSFNELYETKQNKVWYSDAEPASKESEDGDIWFDIAQKKNSFPLNVLITYSSENPSATYPSRYAYTTITPTDQVDQCLIPSNSDDVKIYLSSNKNDSIAYFPIGMYNYNDLILNNIYIDQNSILGDYDLLYLYTTESNKINFNLSELSYNSETGTYTIPEDSISSTQSSRISTFIKNCGITIPSMLHEDEYEEQSQNVEFSMKLVHCIEYTSCPIKCIVNERKSTTYTFYSILSLEDTYFNFPLEFDCMISTTPPDNEEIFDWNFKNTDDISQLTEDVIVTYDSIKLSNIPNKIGYWFRLGLDNDTLLEFPIGDPNTSEGFPKEYFINIYNTIEKLKYYNEKYQKYLININGLSIFKKEITDNSFAFTGKSYNNRDIKFSYEYYPNITLNVEDNFNVKICNIGDYSGNRILRADSNGIVELYFISFENYKEGTGKYLVIKDQISDSIIIKILLDDIEFGSSYTIISNGIGTGSYYKTIEDFCGDITKDIKIQFYIE